jgi:hypothetical protein
MLVKMLVPMLENLLELDLVVWLDLM